MRKPSPLSSDSAERLDANRSLLRMLASDLAVRLKTTDPASRKMIEDELVNVYWTALRDEDGVRRLRDEGHPAVPPMQVKG